MNPLHLLILALIGWMGAQILAHQFFVAGWSKLEGLQQAAAEQDLNRPAPLLRGMSGMATALFIFGALEAYAVINFLPNPPPYGLLMIFAGVITFAIEGILRYGFYYRALLVHGQHPVCARSGFAAFAVTLLAGVILCGAAGYISYSNLAGQAAAAGNQAATGGKGGGSGANTGGNGGKSNPPVRQPETAEWLSKAEAAELLKKDFAYLDLLPRYLESIQPGSTKKEGGEVRFSKAALESLQFAGLPSESLLRGMKSDDSGRPAPGADQEAEPLQE
jgi:hypothetical protein